jgi:tetratricopeptide (TPR) repeat protein
MAQSNAEIKKIIYASLAKQTLGRALAQLALLCKNQPNETLSAITENYQRLLQYWANGGKDPNREVIFNQLLRQAYELTDDLIADRSIKPYASAPLFQKYWEPKRYSASLLQEATQLNQHGSLQDTAWAVSAITLNSLELFDENKLLCLLEFCQSPYSETATRALTGLLLCLLRYKERYHLYPSINNKLRILLDDEQTVANARHILIQLIRSKETAKITQDIQENILPTITKLAPKIHRDIVAEKSFDTDDFEETSDDWQNLLEETGIQNKVETYAHMQRKGSDINYSTFAQMKTYPFFQTMENWFMPFDTAHPMLKDLFGSTSAPKPETSSSTELETSGSEPDSSGHEPKTSGPSTNSGTEATQTPEAETTTLGKLLRLTHFLCDSDKYSFCFNLQLIPAEYRTSLIEQIKMGDEQMKDIEKPSSQVIANLYLQDLYRFYTLCKDATFLTNPFEMEMAAHETSFFHFLDTDGNFMEQLANFLFAQEQYGLALSAFQQAEYTTQRNEVYYKKMGYCYQKMEQYQAAIEQYEKAELMAGKDDWTWRKLAYCHKMLKQHKQALSYYQMLAQQTPNDINVLFNIGSCMAWLGQYKEALNTLYKIEFLQGDNTGSIYFHLYMGHCLWATGEQQEALKHYALFPKDQLWEQLEDACITLSPRDKVYIVDYMRYLTNR